MLIVQALARVLFQMQSFDTHFRAVAAGQIDQHLALADDRLLVLRYLITGWKIGIKIVLPVEDRDRIDLRP